MARAGADQHQRQYPGHAEQQPLQVLHPGRGPPWRAAWNTSGNTAVRTTSAGRTTDAGDRHGERVLAQGLHAEEGSDDQAVEAADQRLHQRRQRDRQADANQAADGRPRPADPHRHPAAHHGDAAGIGERQARSRLQAGPRARPAPGSAPAAAAAWRELDRANSGTVACARRNVAPWRNARSTSGGHGKSGQHGSPDRIRRQQGGGGGQRPRRRRSSSSRKPLPSGGELLSGRVEPAADPVADAPTPRPRGRGRRPSPTMTR